MPKLQVSGWSIGMSIAGAVLWLSGWKNATVADTARALITGQPVPSKGSDVTGAAQHFVTGSGSGHFVPNASGTVAGAPPPGTPLAGRVVAAAETYIGKVPYVWGHQTPAGWDCSGYVTWVMHNDCGIDLPSNVHTTSVVFLVWPGAVTVPRDQCAPGDLVCWGGHVGIAVDNASFANAPNPSQGTVISSIDKFGLPPTIRRPKIYAGST